MSSTIKVPVMGFAAYSGTGKTTLLKQLIPVLRQRGLRVGMIKHAHHGFDIDTPGKDSYELRKAGSSQTLVASSRRFALIVEREDERRPRLDELIGRLDATQLDIILVEGFRHVPFPKIELHRPSQGKPLLFLEDDSIIAIASDAPLAVPPGIDMLDLNDISGIADFVTQHQVSYPAQT
jgi:molybdopterin-guanine dinucleotide biosynthesis protein B